MRNTFALRLGLALLGVALSALSWTLYYFEIATWYYAAADAAAFTASALSIHLTYTQDAGI